jgi:cytochrome c biogenesis protein CcmG/thiol:disulfide interchange protein DsbE
VVLLLGILSLIAVIGLQFARQNTIAPRTGAAPDFTLDLYGGGTFTLSEQRGKIIVVNFWGSWCAPCRDEAPDLQAAHDRFAQDGVMVVGVGFRDTERAARQFIDDLALTYPNGNDTGLKITEDYHVSGAPETYIIDREGNIAAFYIGQFPPEWLTETLNTLIEDDPS